MKCKSSITLQQCLQQRRRNASLQQLYNIGNSVGMGIVGRVFTPTQQNDALKRLIQRHLKKVCMEFVSYFISILK